MSKPLALAANPAIVSAYLFGSIAEGREHRDSDVDIGVLLDRRTTSTAAALAPFLRRTRALKLAALAR